MLASRSTGGERTGGERTGGERGIMSVIIKFT